MHHNIYYEMKDCPLSQIDLNCVTIVENRNRKIDNQTVLVNLHKPDNIIKVNQRIFYWISLTTDAKHHHHKLRQSQKCSLL